LKRLAKNKAKDLNDNNIKLEIIPLVKDKFDYSEFYADVLMLSSEEISQLPDPSEILSKCI